MVARGTEREDICADLGSNLFVSRSTAYGGGVLVQANEIGLFSTLVIQYDLLETKLGKVWP